MRWSEEISFKKLTLAISEDANAFDAVMAAMRLPKNTPEEVDCRNSMIRESAIVAAEIPLKNAELTKDVLKQLVEVSEKGNLNAITDAVTGGALAMAALAGLGANVRVNLLPYPEEADAARLLKKLDAIEKDAATLYTTIKESLKERAGICLL